MMGLNEREVAAEIAIREASDLDRTSLNDLANLYIVRDHLFGPKTREPEPYEMAYSMAAASESTIGNYGDSDFLRAIEGTDPERTWQIINELMDTLQVVNAKVYNSVMRKISNGGR